MKKIRTLSPWGIPLAALLLFSLVNTGQAQFVPGSNSYTNNFDVGANTSNFSGSGSVASWIGWYGSGYNNTPLTNNVSMDAGGSATSGSLMLQACPGGGDQIVSFGTFHNGYGYDFTTAVNYYLYTNVTFDIRVDANAPTNGAGNYGRLSVGAEISYGYTEFGQVTIPASASNSWVHVTVPIPKTLGNLNQTPIGMCFQVAAWVTPTAAPGVTYYIDNYVLEITPGPPPPPPTLSKKIVPAIVGFNQTAANNQGQYDRENIATAVSTGYSFVSQPSVTYSWTNKAWPDIGTANSWQQQLFLVGGGTPGQYDQAVDWNLPNILWFTVQQQTNGTAYIHFNCKTNLPGGNGMLFNTHVPTFTGGTNDWPVEPLVDFPASSPLGAWSVNITSGGLVTITTPDNTTTNFQLDAATTALFGDPFTICLGSQPNNPNGYGKTAVISGFGVRGNTTPFSDNFETDTVLNTNYWKVLANTPDGVNLVPTGSKCWVSWSLPDAGFSIQSAPSLPQDALGWNNPSALTILNNGGRSALVPTSAVGANQAYFRLIQRAFSQLQVILPGETAAPGTGTGKTGTPTAVSLGAGGYEDFVVNAVDANWYPISGVTDMIAITSSDGSAFLPVPQAMVNGVATYSLAFAFSTAGPQTITATDNTTITITPNTSSSVTVGP